MEFDVFKHQFRMHADPNGSCSLSVSVAGANLTVQARFKSELDESLLIVLAALMSKQVHFLVEQLVD